MSIHKSAIIEKGAEIDENVVIGPYSVIGSNVRIGAGTVIQEGVSIRGNTTIGCDNRFFPGAVIGSEPQDLKYRGEKSFLEIGNGNIFREFVTVHSGTAGGGGKTVVGNSNLFMCNVHIAHDCILGNKIIMANLATLGGHVRVENFVNIGGMAGVHHFVTLGQMAFIGGASKIVQDVPPYVVIDGNPSKIRTLNFEGLRRHNIPEENVAALKVAYRALFRSELSLSQAIEKIGAIGDENTNEVSCLIQFFKDREKGKLGRALEAYRKDIG